MRISVKNPVPQQKNHAFSVLPECSFSAPKLQFYRHRRPHILPTIHTWNKQQKSISHRIRLSNKHTKKKAIEREARDYWRLSEGLEEMNILREIMAERFKPKITSSKGDNKWSKEGESRVALELVPGPSRNAYIIGNNSDSDRRRGRPRRRSRRHWRRKRFWIAGERRQETAEREKGRKYGWREKKERRSERSGGGFIGGEREGKGGFDWRGEERTHQIRGAV